MKSNTSLSAVNCPWNKLLTLVSTVLLGAAFLTPQPVAAQAAAVEASIHGGGRASTVAVTGNFLQLSTSVFAVQAKLLSDGSATGFFTVNQLNNDSFSNFNTELTGWEVLLEGTYVLRGPFVNGAEVIIYIEEFGGPGVGRWTMYKHMFDGFSHTFITLDATVGAGRISLH